MWTTGYANFTIGTAVNTSKVKLANRKKQDTNSPSQSSKSPDKTAKPNSHTLASVLYTPGTTYRYNCTTTLPSHRLTTRLQNIIPTETVAREKHDCGNRQVLAMLSMRYRCPTRIAGGMVGTTWRSVSLCFATNLPYLPVLHQLFTLAFNSDTYCHS